MHSFVHFAICCIFLLKSGVRMYHALSVADTFRDIGNAILSFRSLADVLDVLLVAFVIYSAIKLIRETRAIQLAKGFILLLLLYAAVYLLNMEVSSYMFSLLFSNILLVLVIIFSPEIRHALDLFNFKHGDEIQRQERLADMINAVTKACADMSDKRIGALLVFERESILGDIINTGTLVDASISAEMIGNIFYPKAPLHDGAAVIRDARICAAGCILPLTKNTNLSSELGTRHRAALGMSEQSDALVIVVSEETGAISAASKGNLRRGLSSGDLRELLTQTFIKTDNNEDNRLKKLLKGRRKHEETASED